MSEIQTTNYPATAKVLVRSENQGRTALGIFQAYCLIHPEATLDDLNRAFPREKFASTKKLQDTFITVEELGQIAQAEGDERTMKFVEDVKNGKTSSYYYTLGDGTQVTNHNVVWGQGNFPTLVEWAKQYDIYVASFEKGKRGKLGYYELEYLNNWKPQVEIVEKVVEKEVVREVPVERIVEKEVEKKHIPWWVWLLLALAVVGIILALLLRPKGEPQVVTVTDTVVQTVVDTVYIQQLEEIEDHFNTAQFQKDKADLSEEAKFVLHDLAKLMNRNPDLRLRIEGHTSAEGDAAHNQKLSEARAQAAVTFLVEHEGIDASRLEAAGFGSSKLKNADDSMDPVNRRTEFEII